MTYWGRLKVLWIGELTGSDLIHLPQNCQSASTMLRNIQNGQPEDIYDTCMPFAGLKISFIDQIRSDTITCVFVYSWSGVCKSSNSSECSKSRLPNMLVGIKILSKGRLGKLTGGSALVVKKHWGPDKRPPENLITSLKADIRKIISWLTFVLQFTGQSFRMPPQPSKISW